MGHVPKRIARAIGLGPAELLSFEMSEASRHLGVDCPIQKRDRKSGARKRSQMETERERQALRSAG